MGRVLHAWRALLKSPNVPETKVLGFLRDHAALFLCELHTSPFVVNELRLGADFRADFMRPIEQFSAGTAYELIEIESPGDLLFKANGDPSAAFSTALDQIRKWRMWLARKPQEAQCIFPSMAWTYLGSPSFRFMIIMGRRKETQTFRDVLAEISRAEGVAIHSFDWLTDKFNAFRPSSFVSTALAAQLKRFASNLELLNKAASPFVKAVSDQDWRKVVDPSADCHLLAFYLSKVAPILKQNDQLAQDFLRELGSLLDPTAVDDILAEDRSVWVDN